ncbi:MAG TPA: NHL repeat-containing protein [Candidatus Cybelea sp.]|jgi:outer membrane protein assembly factor BamB|nr:NHL repeat-containing protein [Candidatus Cybelea sp.]
MNASAWKFLPVLVLATSGLTACGGAGSPVAPGGPQTVPQSASLERAHAPRVASCLTMTCLYVTNQPNNRHDPGAYAIAFAVNANGNVTPVQTIRGAKTDLSQPGGIAVDAGGNIYITNQPARVIAFPPGANGNVAPLRIIEGPRTGLKFPTGIALDPGSNIYVTQFEGSSGPGSVQVYAAGANGNVAPLRTIKGGRAGLNFPIGITLDASSNIYVASAGQFGGVTVYAAGAHGDAKPLREIRGDRTQLNNPIGIALDASGKLYVGNGQGDQVNVYAAGANGNVAPIRVIAGLHTKLRLPLGVALDAGNNLYVVDSPQGSPGARTFVRVYAAGANGDVAPIRSIGGSNTEIEQPDGIAVH